MQQSKGFTLIELLIVIAIIGIIAAVSVPNLIQARRSAQIKAEQTYVRNVFVAANAYLSENIQSTNVPNSDCRTGFVASGYSVNVANAGSLSSCTVTVTNATASVSYVGISGTGNLP